MLCVCVCVSMYFSVPLIKIHYLISVICSYFRRIIVLLSYNKTEKDTTAVSVLFTYTSKRNARGKPLKMRVFEFEMK